MAIFRPVDREASSKELQLLRLMLFIASTTVLDAEGTCIHVIHVTCADAFTASAASASKSRCAGPARRAADALRIARVRRLHAGGARAAHAQQAEPILRVPCERGQPGGNLAVESGKSSTLERPEAGY